MTTPKKDEILRKAREIAMMRQIRVGLPAITPTEFELKESGVFEEARLDLMGSGMDEPIGKSAALSEQLRYLNVMAQEMKLRVIPIKELRVLKRETGVEWTNGWTKQEKRRKKPPPTKKKMQRVSLRKPLDIGGAIRGASIIHRMTKEVRKLPSIKAMIDLKPKAKVKRKIKVKVKKRRKISNNRTGLTMRSLRKVKGVKVFSFPDDIWKVKPRRRKRR